MKIDWIKWIIIAAVAFTYGIVGKAAYEQGRTVGKEEGVVKGLELYQNYCYNKGGPVIGNDGTVIACEPLGLIPKEELDRMKQKDVDKSSNI